MSEPGNDDRLERLRSRREPPPLIPVTVAAKYTLNSRALRLSFEGAGLEAMLEPTAASVRLLVPSPGADELVMPEWNGNEFLLPGEVRPALRTFTPLRSVLGGSTATGGLDLEIVRHSGGAVSSWAERVEVGAPAAISGPGRGFEHSADTNEYHLLGDETAVPAMGQLLETLPPTLTITVHIEVVHADAIRPLPEHPGATLEWLVDAGDEAPGSRLVAAAKTLPDLSAESHVWAAGEAASMQAIRKHLFDDRGLTRSQATIRGYWKPERDAG